MITHSVKIINMAHLNYLRWELKHGSTNNQRCGVMLGCEGQCVCPNNCPQTSVCQDCLCSNDDLKTENCPNDSFALTWMLNCSCDAAYFIDTRHDPKYGSISNYCCFNAGCRETGCHRMSLEISEGLFIFWHNYAITKLLGLKYVWPTWQKGAHSATMTWNLRLRAASLRKASTVRERPTVMMTSLEWMCSSACMAMLSVVPSV